MHFTIRFHLCPPFFSAAGRFALLLQFIGQCALNLQRCRKSKSCSPGFKILTSAGAEYRRDFGQRFVVWSFPPTTTVAPFAASCRLMLAQKRKLKLDLCNDKTLPSERSWCILLREVHQPAVASRQQNWIKQKVRHFNISSRRIIEKGKLFSLHFQASCISAFHPIDHEKLPNCHQFLALMLKSVGKKCNETEADFSSSTLRRLDNTGGLSF